MQRPLSIIAKATGVVAACLLAYRGLQLYRKNDITIYITEVVHLPETAGRPRRPQRCDSTTALSIEGKIEMEACLMSSYRFLLRLTGQVKGALLNSSKSAAANQSPRSARHRVMSLQTTTSYSSYRDDDSVSNASVSGSRKHGPAIMLSAVDPIVDAYEAETSGILAFTPACLGEGLLCRYTCTTGDEGGAARDATADNSMSTSSPASPLVSGGGGGDSGMGSIYVRSCFLESDGATAYCQRLTMEIEFVCPVFGARVVVRLPSKHCRLQHSSCSTGGVGTLTQLLHQPRKCVWDIGEVSEEMCSVAAEEMGMSGVTDVEALMPGAVVPAAASSCARLELVFEQPPPGIAFGEDADASPSDDSDEDEENRFGSTASSVKSGSSRKRNQSAAAAARRASTSATNRSRKREERARKAAEKAARIEDASSSGTELYVRGGGNSSGDDVPSVEVVFSVNRLLSGTSVKKLQVLQEAANWAPRSRLDRLVLRRFVPSLEKMKLKKLAHYTTWFVQPVSVSQLQ